MNNDFYIPYDDNGNVYELRRSLSGLLLPGHFDVDEDETTRDLEYMKSMYPDKTQELLRMVEEKCDALDYDGSPMYSEYPDKERMRKYASEIYDEYVSHDESAATLVDMFDERYFRPDAGYYRPDCADGMECPEYPYPPYVRRNPCCRNTALRNVIEILLCQEFFCRRQRCRRRRHRYY